MARIELSDPALPKSPLGPRLAPFFWCLECVEWGPAFFDISGPNPKPLPYPPSATTPRARESNEEDLEEIPVALVRVPGGKNAGSKGKVGGSPNWIQAEATPDCPKCQKPMAFALQLASDSRISFCDMGMLYGFVCPECVVGASLIQSH
jgi:hypothetical protein